MAPAPAPKIIDWPLDQSAQPEPEPEPEQTAQLAGLPQIGDFTVHRLLGEGGMGRVYEARERLSKRRVALKVLRSELARSTAGRQAFVNEMGILASLDDPHIVRCLHCTEAEGELVMALEYLEGHTLREHMLRRGPLPWDEVVAIASQIAAALAAAHGAEQAIIHRDLKPENVMLLGALEPGASERPPPRVKVMDFGIAKIVQAASGATTHSVGTLQYMSPEQIDALPLTPRADLYALGLLMWELLAGRPPFAAESPRLLLDKQCTEPAPQLPADARRGLPRGVEALIHQLLEKAPEDRPADAEAVRARLEPFCPAELAPAQPGCGRDIAVDAVDAVPAHAPGSEPTPRADAAPSIPARKDSAARVAPRLDTIALVEGTAGPREVSAKTAALVILGLSALAGLITYLIRALLA
ncbi:serine/threonine protein kinase [Pseudenhygromyxa sp. WMMC2535]|uniref:serine/threonine-protein kinase n=1 Tax=Pseudenhygromyxa sp. WMMC2535 TaxID=2712867 RepID=UPI0015569224|nr:serine/threonine-protein kinase [Pseudenhygromyxa sp. WMMC2535]NVB39542.1 serine/threonine protein kinase [Pseudenhygromyxa sp. WMMC2535]